MVDDLPAVLALTNDVVQAAIVIFGIAVALYNLRHVFHDRVTRAFNSLLFFVVVAVFAELMATRATASLSTENWIRLAWIGIAMVPAAQFHLADALLVTTGNISSSRRTFVRVWYLTGVAFFSLALFTSLIVAELVPLGQPPRLSAGPLFPLFAAYYWLISATSVYYVWLARKRCVTRTTRKRMTVILVSFLAAPLAVFPYLTLSGDTNLQVSVPFWLVVIAGNVVVGTMFAFMAYYLAYFGASSPDRVVRVRLFKFMARVPLAATLVLLAYVGVNQLGSVLGLPVETALAIVVVATVILVEWSLHTLKRPLERLFQLTDEPEVHNIQQLSERLLTTRDFRQFLESVLAAACEVLRTPTAFVVGLGPEGPILEAVIGPLTEGGESWTEGDLQDVALSAREQSRPEDYLESSGQFILWSDYWIYPLHSEVDGAFLGILGIKARASAPDLSEAEEQTFERLTEQAVDALQDRLLQQEVFAAVEGLLPEVTRIQRRRSAATFGGTPVLIAPESNEVAVVSDADFNTLVRDALSHYWGGPKLTKSPLLRLQIVQRAMREHGGNQTKALRDILARAVDQQRPEGERSMTTAEWILYNILELKFIQGQKVRDVARRLAMSESDLYRKQRVAIENVARTISMMEKAVLADLKQD
jgi:hypothetical protein